MPEQALALKIDGMHCGSCVMRVTNALKKVDGVTVENVEIGAARLTFDPARAAAPAIVEAVNKIGFTAQEV